MTIEDISKIVREKAEIMAANRRNKHKRKPYHRMYDKAVDMYERIRVHSEADVFPEHLFREKAPNQTSAEWHYQKRLFKAVGSITNPYWDKAMGAINRIWNEKNYTIKYPEITAAEYVRYPAAEYFTNDFPYSGSIESFFAQVVTPMKMEDPNAFLTIVPSYTEDNEPAAPYCKIYRSDKVLGFKEGVYLLVLTEDRSVVTFGGRKEKDGKVLRFFDSTGVYRIEQIGDLLDFKFGEPELELEYNFTEMPAWRLKGKPVESEGKTLYQSYFYGAIPSLNSAIIDYSTSQMGKVAHAFPERWEYTDDCDNSECEGGRIWSEEGGKFSTCGACMGTGRRNLSSVMNVLQVKVPNPSMPAEADTSKMQIPPAGYIAKTDATDQLNFLDESIDRAIVRAFAMMNIDVSNSSVKGDETALGKSIDREELFSFLLLISTELFDLMGKAINYIGAIRYGEAWSSVAIGYPSNFAILTSKDITAEISEAITSEIPDVAIQSLLHEYADTRFNSQDGVMDMFDLTFAADRLMLLSQQDISAKQITRLAQPWEVILHDSLAYIVKQVEGRHSPSEAYPSWWYLPLMDKVTQVQDEAKAMAASFPVVDVNRFIEGE